MSTDFLMSLQKLLTWLFAFLTALLPQHLMERLIESDPAPRPLTAVARPHAAPDALKRVECEPRRHADTVPHPVPAAAPAGVGASR